ncbi:Spo0E family sporulation regulatory protein-aspartic acid phosphatase [Virgibacillus necropolis]|uniref:Spo0E family sporulation regulatory protein-aspartic acid phosphatase n=2 Tax=Virgibacillus necropolis TaxID=163877 RepID=A0A221MID5_9BACI|nr:Spo0E family sporulation regulatory protein-aspartic acid phosphatase [Virgibacillus necropolis]
MQSINTKRQEMIHLAMNKGFTNKETVKCSKELDSLLDLHMKVKTTTPLYSSSSIG